MSKRHTVSISNPIYEQLKREGKFGESFSDLLSRLLEELGRRDGGDSSPRSMESKSKSGHKIAKIKQGSLDIGFPHLSSESGIPQQ